MRNLKQAHVHADGYGHEYQWRMDHPTRVFSADQQGVLVGRGYVELTGYGQALRL